MSEWVPIRGYETRYLINRQGEVRSLRLRRGNGLLATSIYQGALYVSLMGDGGRNDRKRFAVHNLVAEAFRGPKPYGALVLARDGNRLNCSAENIYYDTEEVA